MWPSSGHCKIACLTSPVIIDWAWALTTELLQGARHIDQTTDLNPQLGALDLDSCAELTQYSYVNIEHVSGICNSNAVGAICRFVISKSRFFGIDSCIPEAVEGFED